MKNVTGYDLVKFLAGSYGTLAVLTEVTFKVLPAPETEATLVLAGLDDDRAVAALSAALGSPFSVTGAAHLPGRRRAGADLRPHRRLRRLGRRPAPSVCATLLAGFGTAEILDADASADLWRDDPRPRRARRRRLTRRSGASRSSRATGPRSPPPSVRAFDCRILYDWGGGLVWIAGGEGSRRRRGDHPRRRRTPSAATPRWSARPDDVRARRRCLRAARRAADGR